MTGPRRRSNRGSPQARLPADGAQGSFVFQLPRVGSRKGEAEFFVASRADFDWTCGVENQALKLRFVSQPIQPEPGTFEPGAMARGGPGLPVAFRWGQRRLVIQEVLGTWRESAPCTHGSGERYLARHGFVCRLESGETARVYFERRPGRGGRRRWWLLGFLETDASPRGHPPSGRAFGGDHQAPFPFLHAQPEQAELAPERRG